MAYKQFQRADSADIPRGLTIAATDGLVLQLLNPSSAFNKQCVLPSYLKIKIPNIKIA